MRLDLRELIVNPERRLPFHFSVDKLFAFDYNILVSAKSEVLIYAA